MDITKQILKYIKEKKSTLSQIQKMRILYLALMQKDAKFVLDYLHLSPLENETFMLNFRAIAYSQLKRFDDSFNQISQIISLEQNIQNEFNGLVFKYTVCNFSSGKQFL